MDGTERDVQHLIMLSVLSAQSADEPAPFAPRNPHRFHVAILPQSRKLAPEEPPTLPCRPASTLASLVRRPRTIAQRRHMFRVGER